jgi:hypothetical protein
MRHPLIVLLFLSAAACPHHADKITTSPEMGPSPRLDMTMLLPDAGPQADMTPAPDLEPSGPHFPSCAHGAGPACGFAALSAIARPAPPANVATGDFNHDNKTDILINAPPFLSVLLSNGDGTFKQQVDTLTLHTNYEMQGVGDFDHDNNLDVLVEDRTGFVVWLGKGDGTFTRGPAQEENSTGNAQVIVADFNDDHVLDVVIAGGSLPSLCLGLGDGSFTAPSPLAGFAAGFANAIASGDIDGDGHLDLVVITNPSSPSPPRLRVMFGDGKGAFAQTVDTVTNYVDQPVVQDLDGDGKADVLIDHGTGIDVFISQGRSFKPAKTSVVGGLMIGRSDQLADFDGDHKLDLIRNSDVVQVLPGDGAGGFGAPVAHAPLDGFSNTIAAGDFKGDGVSAVVSIGNHGVLRVSAPSGDYDIPAAAYIGVDVTNSDVADLNGDNRPDVVVFGGASRMASCALQQKDGSFTFLRQVYTTANSDSTGVVAGDFDHDAHVDMLIPGQLLLGNGDGTFHPGATIPPGNVLAAGDLNEDGFLEAIISDGKTTQIGLSDKSGPFKSFVPQGGPSALVRLSDVNQDKHLDLVALNTVSFHEGTEFDLNVYLGAGDGTFKLSYSTSFDAQATPDLTLGDFNCDGKLDIVVANAFFFGVGDGTFQRQPSWSAQAQAVGDFNRDGLLDIVSGDSGVLTIRLGNGDSTLKPATTIQLLSSADNPIVATTDLNVDGRPDVLATSGNMVQVLVNSCAR